MNELIDQYIPAQTSTPPVTWRNLARGLLKGTALGEELVSLANAKMTYSQFGEDAHLSSYYARLAHGRNIVVKNGYFVDIGAFRPMVCSNSYFFYKRRWRGINIDPTPGFKRLFDKLRPRDVNLEIGVSPEGKSATLFLFGRPSVWNTLDPDFAAYAAGVNGTMPHRVPVTLSRLDDVLDRHLKGAPLELLLIDAEGYDLEILKSNDFSKYRPRVVLIEALDISAETLASNPIVTYLDQFGYKVYSWINPNLMFVRDDSLVS